MDDASSDIDSGTAYEICIFDTGECDVVENMVMRRRRLASTIKVRIPVPLQEMN